MTTPQILDGLFLIDLPQERDGFEKFISAWFFKDEHGRRILVDPGPASTIEDLCGELGKLTDDLDIILLTHIHLDHSGGVGQLLQKYRRAKIVVSERGKKHLLSPEKLWNASVETLGDVANLYKEPIPVSEENFFDGKPGGIEIFETPGHAPHHISFRVPFGDKNLFFVGEAAGMTLPSKTRYLRPTTPPKFDGTAALNTLNMLCEICTERDILCYSHFGADDDARGALCAAREQLGFWTESVKKWLEEGKELETMRDLLIQTDPQLSQFVFLPENLRSRELGFIKNSLQGFAGWLSRR